MNAKKLAAALALVGSLGTFGGGAVVVATSAEAGRASVTYHDSGAGRAGRA